MNVQVILRHGVLAGAAAALLAACGASSQQVSGKVLGGTQAAATTISATGGGSGICAGAVAGTQVIIKDPSGKLLATTTLHRDAKATAALHLPTVMTGPEGQVGLYDFSTSIPAGSGPYTVDVVGVSSLVVPASQLGHLTLSCG